MIDPLQRINRPQIEELIAQERYFVLHAPRQTGKTSCMLALMDYLNAQGDYRALYTNIESAQVAREQVQRGIRSVAYALARTAKYYLQDDTLAIWLRQHAAEEPAENLLTSLLEAWCQQTDKPIVLFIDEIDALVGDTLISVLRQIRAGYAPVSYTHLTLPTKA